MYFALFSRFTVVLLAVSHVSCAPAEERRSIQRTSPPQGCLVVRASGAKSGEYGSLSAAVASLGSGTNPACIFVYSGTYQGQTTLKYNAPLTIYGYTTDASDYHHNTVTLSHSASSSQAGTLDSSSTLQVLGSNVKVYNIDIENTYGKVGTYSQAVAVTSNGNDLSFYGCRFTSYQDTLYVKAGDQYFKKCYIEGAVDYIFGAANVWIGQCDIASNGAGYITASGRSTDDKTRYVIDSSTVAAASGYTETAKVYLGRPWRKLARVIYQNSKLSGIINPDGWFPFIQDATPTYEEYNNSGDGSNTSKRKYETKASGAMTIGQVFAGNYCSWIDCSY